MADPRQAAARAFFPRGLYQPEGSFRFGLDALLLAAFASRQRPGWKRLADLGCGVGPVAFAALLFAEEESLPERTVIGVDNQPDLLEAAGKNAELLGLSSNFKALNANLLDPDQNWATAGMLDVPLARACDLVCSNPPYRLPGSGRVPASLLRRSALFGDRSCMEAFIRTGSFIMSHQGSYCLVLPPERLDEVIAYLAAYGLRLGTIQPVVTVAGQAPGLYLLAAGRINSENKGIDPQVEKPLVLHSAQKGAGKSGLTAEAIEFCPFLAANA